MSVEIDPLELGFRRPFTVEVAETLRISNPNTLPVYFKVKTTAPKQYCVRPNSGRIEPGSSVEVSVLLQAMKIEPPLDARCRDKFLVQSVLVTMDRERETMAKIWETVQKSDIQEKKIRVAWLPTTHLNNGVVDAPPPVATPVRSGVANGQIEATPDTVGPAYSSPRDGDTTLLDDSSFVAQQPSEPRIVVEPPAPPSPPTPHAAANSATSTTAGASGESYEDLKQQIAKAEAVIASLRSEIASGSGLRQRKATGGGAENEKETGAAAQQLAQAPRPTEGVPVQVVALLCLVSFLLAYFFF
ncbi:hypothetical protein VTJ83DRAFT_4022 [Remersonia thermophila]|uniref:MSP domain-containing protein n=1 Tax=Remersonia thermophila TaxID=72144 RepID=A0ABR4DFQ4_9PEZI